MKFYYSPTSPFVKKVEIVARECGLFDAMEIIETKVQQGDPNRVYGDAVNPLRQIPSLEVAPGDILFDSFVICDYLIRRSGNLTMLPVEGEQRTHVLKTHALCNGITERAVQTRYESVRPEGNQWPAMIDDNLDRIRSGLALLNAEVAHKIDGPFDLSEAAFVAMLNYLDFRFPDLNWRQNFPNLVEPFEALSEFGCIQATYAQ